MIKKIVNIIHKVELVICMAGLIVLTVCLFIGAFARTINHPLGWTNDIGMLMLAWSTFLGGDIAFRNGRLSNLDTLVAKFPVKLQKTFAVINYSVILAFLILIIWFGFKLTWSTRFRTFNGVPNFSYSWVTVSMPVSACFMVFTAVKRLINVLKAADPAVIAKM